MKKLIILLSTVIFLFGCKKSFLDRTPLDQQTEVTAFKTYDNFKTYTWGLYDIFVGYGNNGGADSDPTIMQGDRYSDNMAYAIAGSENPWAYQKQIVPTSGGGWDFSYIRRTNLMLDNIDQSTMTQGDKDHWRSVGLLFRAVRYLQLISRFGDVPWLEHVVKDNDKDILFGARTPRDQVAANMLKDLLWAEEHIKATGDGPNTINVNVVRAIISRFGLFEGTWRKYHGLNDPQTYLQASVAASTKLLTAFPAINGNYDMLYNSEDLSGMPGVILFKAYAIAQWTHGLTRYERTSSCYHEMAKDAVESYLCSDGKPVATSALYSGDDNMYTEFRNRDRRLYFTVIPPYKVTTTPAGGNATVWGFTANPADREYIDLMKTIVGPSSKTLPVSNWSGFYVRAIPHFRNFPDGQGYIASELGYEIYKFYNTTTPTDASNNTTDCPVLHIEEAMLNHAEASFELGQFTQTVADQTINKLRTRVGVAAMNVGDINGTFDPNRDATVDPVLWEIRRERRVELMGEGFRFDDLRRWKKATYLNKQQLGVKIKKADYNNAVKVKGGGAEGYVEFFDVPQGWLDYYYLYPLPLDNLALNPQLKQNPEWKK